MQIVIIVVDTVISIHALLAESDFMFSVVFYLENIFLSTLSLRRATTCGGGWNEQPRYFYPRSPCGERPFVMPFFALLVGTFLSTLSLRRATEELLRKYHRVDISIHALLAESDCLYRFSLITLLNFYPRSPCGERPLGNAEVELRMWISIHALLAESDSKSAQNSGALLRI